MAHFPEKLSAKLAERKITGALRELPGTLDLVDFTSNDYLGLSRNESVAKRAWALLQERKLFLNGATGARLLSGNHPLYRQLETTLSKTHCTEAALVFNSGYDANLGFFGSVPQRGDLVLYDELIHASIRDGIQMGLAKSYKFRHNDVQSLNSLLSRNREQLGSKDVIYVVTESVFSMDGDSPDLNELVSFCKKEGCYLVVDEAHAVGMFGTAGEGLVQELELEKEVFARIVTFGKALGCHGAAILGSNTLTQYLMNFARSFIYTTGLPPHSVATIQAAYETMTSSLGADSRKELHQNIAYFRDEIVKQELEAYFIPSASAIHCAIFPGILKVKELAAYLKQHQFNVKPIVAPTVPAGEERLRFCLHAYNTKEQLSEVLYRVSKFLANS